MNKDRKRHYLVAIINFFIFAVLFLLHYSQVLKITAIRANAVTVIPFLVAFAFFNEEWATALSGMAVGIFMDSSAARFSLFHTVLLTVIGLSVSLIIHHLFNNNIRSAIALSVLAAAFYYLLRWLFFEATGGSIDDNAFYLLYYALPSVVYTSIFIIPFYYLEKKLFEIKII